LLTGFASFFGTPGARVCASHFSKRDPGADYVAQICNLPYRGFVIRKPSEYPFAAGRTNRSAECNSAIQQITNLRYVPDEPGTSEKRTPRVRCPGFSPFVKHSKLEAFRTG
jgi:hypothetical protein